MPSEADAARLKEYGIQLARHVFERDGDALVRTISEIIAHERLTIREESRTKLLATLDSAVRQTVSPLGGG
jgi:hypothetical protein